MSLKGKSAPSTPPLLKNAALAPIIYFDSIPVFGALGGNIEVELAARLLMPKSDGSVAADMNCTAHLRCPLLAAMALRDALDKAIAMASPRPSKSLAINGDDDDEPVSHLLTN